MNDVMKSSIAVAKYEGADYVIVNISGGRSVSSVIDLFGGVEGWSYHLTPLRGFCFIKIFASTGSDKI